MVPIVDFQEDPQPFFVMPYLQLGSLKDENFQVPLAEEETFDLLIQGLIVLEHLHSRGVAYRDLKPENILVEGRSPLHVQFTDFGFANDQSDLKTCCGTARYSAPEIYSEAKYTTAVDIWSLGVIVLEYIYGLPLDLQACIRGEAALKERGPAWCRRLVEYVNDWDPDPLIDLLVAGMLRIEPRERFSAALCLTKLDDLGLLDKPSASSGDATPTQTRALASAVRNEEETPTVIASTLWDAGMERWSHDDHNDDDQAERSASPSMTSKSHQLGVSGSQSDINTPRPRKESPKAISGRLNDHVRASLEPRSPPEARSMHARSKRRRSPAVSSSGNPSDRSRVKRRPPKAGLTQVSPESDANKVSFS